MPSNWNSINCSARRQSDVRKCFSVGLKTNCALIRNNLASIKLNRHCLIVWHKFACHDYVQYKYMFKERNNTFCISVASVYTYFGLSSCLWYCGHYCRLMCLSGFEVGNDVCIFSRTIYDGNMKNPVDDLCI